MYRISKWKEENEEKQNRHYITLYTFVPAALCGTSWRSYSIPKVSVVPTLNVCVGFSTFTNLPAEWFHVVWLNAIKKGFIFHFHLVFHPFYVVSCVPTTYWLLIFVLVYVRLIREHLSWRAASPWSYVKSQACGVSQSVVLIKKYDFSNCHVTDLTTICKIFSVLCRSVCPNGVSTWTLW